LADLRVIEIFDSLQGEGYWAGVPMTFIRLAGCNAPVLGLECVRWCDTPGSWDTDSGATLAPQDILDRMYLPRLCLTGGEPLLQAEGVLHMVVEARRRGIKVHLETNGTVDPPRNDRPGASPSPYPAPPPEPLFDWAVVSPKPPGYFIAPGWAGLVDELKLVSDERLEVGTAERLAAQHPEAVVCIQPVWEDGAGASTAYAIGLVMEHPGWRLSLQTHKYLGIR
jgi:7-carboxy-7-deazaguanine synthase